MKQLITFVSAVVGGLVLISVLYIAFCLHCWIIKKCMELSPL